VELKEEMIVHDEPIKHLGEHLIDINLSPEAKTQITVVIKPEQER
jgi:ribosomal protein L9